MFDGDCRAAAAAAAAATKKEIRTKQVFDTHSGQVKIKAEAPAFGSGEEDRS